MFSVLFVDDEPDLLEVAKLHLEKSGSFAVDTFRSAPQVLQALEEKRYDAIIADYDMPLMTGLDLLKELKARGDTTPFIMLTHVDHDGVVMDTVNSGATYFIRKGADLDAPFAELLVKLQLAVRQNNAGRTRQLFSAISRHDLLNRLAAMDGYVQLVKSSTDDKTILGYMEKQQQILVTIQDQIRFIGDYEKIGIRDPVWQPLAPLIRQAATLPPADLVTLTLEGVDSVELHADPLIPRVFYNLIDNSLRHGKHVTSIRVTGAATGDGFLITYEDNGVGVPGTDKETIFLRGKGQNTGLGLFLIREILGITAIQIRENGESGTGARFEILVPGTCYRDLK